MSAVNHPGEDAPLGQRRQHHCVRVRFRGSGLDVDVVPVLYEGDVNDYGYLVRKYSGERVLTSIPDTSSSSAPASSSMASTSSNGSG